jgi:hypothetical protein
MFTHRQSPLSESVLGTDVIIVDGDHGVTDALTIYDAEQAVKRVIETIV